MCGYIDQREMLCEKNKNKDEKNKDEKNKDERIKNSDVENCGLNLECWSYPLDD